MSKATTVLMRARCTLEFKQETVRPKASGQNVRPRRVRWGWRIRRLSTASRLSAVQMEIARLRTELARFKMEGEILGKQRRTSRKRKAEVRRHQPVPTRVADLCAVAGYREHFVRLASPSQRRHLRDDALLGHIKAIHGEAPGSYVWPHTWKEPLAKGIRVQGHHGQQPQAGHRAQPAGQAVHLGRARQVWDGDITYIAPDEEWLSLAVVMYLFIYQVVGWSLRQDMTRDIVIDAVSMAWFKRQPSKQSGLSFPSDGGSHYASDKHRAGLKEYCVAASVSRRQLLETVARQAIRHKPPGPGRGHRWDVLVQPYPNALDASLRQADAVRAKLALCSGQQCQLGIRLWKAECGARAEIFNSEFARFVNRICWA